MDRYVTGNTIRKLREERRMTQEELASELFVSAKTVSKWETGKGFPDISLLEPLAAALHISVMELLAGGEIKNENRSANMLRSHFYMCPVCGNVILSTGNALISCCGITLPPLQTEDPEEAHRLLVSRDADEFFVEMPHAMTKEHYISFLAAVSDQGIQFVKLYPEGAAEARFKAARVKWIYAFCNRHGLYRTEAGKP
ncbi:MAG: helix-turn-helix domain-containing protein [Clostridia bacterium]|nr:helix-turn-helix domain-containing protein [Clostridia bacterium]